MNSASLRVATLRVAMRRGVSSNGQLLRRLAVRVDERRARAGVEQDLQHALLAVLCGRVQRRRLGVVAL
eukprot:3011465-Prymnesium_polylepis.1